MTDTERGRIAVDTPVLSTGAAFYLVDGWETEGLERDRERMMMIKCWLKESVCVS